MNNEHASEALAKDEKNDLKEQQKEQWEKTLHKMRNAAAEEDKYAKEKKQVQSELKQSVEVYILRFLRRLYNFTLVLSLQDKFKSQGRTNSTRLSQKTQISKRLGRGRYAKNV